MLRTLLVLCDKNQKAWLLWMKEPVNKRVEAAKEGRGY